MTPSSWLPIRYRDFYDVPRLVIVAYEGTHYLFDSPFDDDVDDYVGEYVVYRLPESAVAKLEEPSWTGLPSLGEELWRVSVDLVEFDRSRRQFVSDSVFRHLEAG